MTGPSGLRSAALEAGLVVLGVVLALGAQAGWEARERQQRADAALDAIVLEMRANLEEVERSFVYHGLHTNAIREAIRAGLPPGWDAELFGEGYIRTTDLVRSAWESAEATGALERIDYDVLLLLTRLYAQQERYDRLVGWAGPQLFAAIFEPRDGTVPQTRAVGLRDFAGSLAFREVQLARCYRLALDALGAGDVPEAPENSLGFTCPEGVASLARAVGSDR